MNKRTVILGTGGQLGTALCNLFQQKNVDYIGYDLPEIDLNDPETYLNKIIEFDPEVLVNCVAYTNVARAEIDRSKAMSTNAMALIDLIDLCNSHKIILYHISTDYVFSGKSARPYIEDDPPDPINFYGLTKYMGEKLIRFYSDNFAIIRTAALYGKSISGTQNIVGKLIRAARENDTIKLVTDETTSPTFANDLAKQIYLIINKELDGLIHATSEENCNWVEFGKYLFELLKIDIEVEEVESSFFNKTLRKPVYSVLENSVLKDHELNIMPDWKGALKNYLDKGI